MGETISVIIPAYNAAAHLKRTVESALAQTHPPLEILVVDDGSKDRTAEVVAAMPPPVRLIRKENGGPATARNLGAQQARGDWLALLDADDWWFPDKLRAQLECVVSDDIGLVHCLPDHRNDIVPPRLTFEHMWDRNWIINSSVLMRRAAFEALDGFNEARELISVEDYNLWVRMAASDWALVTCATTLVHYTRGIGISSNSERFMRASLYNIDDLGERLKLPETMIRQKRNEVVFDFAQKALYERELPTARRLFLQTFRRQPTVRHGMHVLISTLPETILDLRRKAVSVLDRPESRHAPATEGQPGGTTAIDEAWLLEPSRVQASIVDRRLHTKVNEAVFTRPVLVTTVDAEEDFDWTRPFSSAATDVTSMRSQYLAHRIFERYGVIPTYMVDHPVASQDEGRAPLLELLQDRKCEIGAQLHPWVTPPLIESVSERNSYAGNLPAALEYSKIQALTQELQAAFDVTPRIFRAGRYGAGPNTGNILRHFGYQVDTSVVPCWSFADQGGPDFRSMTARPYWIDRDHQLLELPLSAALVGRAGTLPPNLTSHVFGRRSEQLALPSVMARLGLLERIKLTPEGIAIEEAKRLVRHMTAQSHRIFVLTYHSPSLEPGNTPYVRTNEDLARFLGWLDEFYDFFASEIGGTFASWRDVRATLMPADHLES